MQIKNRKTNNKGITLIALVITIIVLLILAGVAIATLTGDNGVLTKAAKAKQETQKATEDELRRLTMLKAISNIENTTYTETNGDKATIPAGFAVSQVEGENTVQNGLVIIDANGNEFVWIPVPTAISDTEANGTTNKAMAINLGTEENPQYRGLLYDFTDTDSTVRSGCTTTTSSYREPAYLTDSSTGDVSSYNTVGITEASLQNDYNDMIKSVYLNNGFYVARYEMSLDANKNAQSKKNVTSTDASQADTNMWYGLYNKAKNYALKTDTTKNVVSSMIWGSQYDAMMNWMHKDSNVNVNSKTPVAGTSKNTTRITGGPNEGETESKDILKNVYDLLGNSREWTLEAYNSSYRLSRGGSYGDSGSPASRVGSNPDDTNDSGGGRLALYIK